MKEKRFKKVARVITTATLAAGFSVFASCVQALKTDDDTLVEGAKLCTRYLPRHERQYGIPEHLLAAIASTESGRFHRSLGLNLPWPWTINVEGAGYFFDTKEEAISAVRSFQSRGIASIDVGCMQVNLMHHPNAFASLDQAFDPAYNVAYAAQFLKANFQEEGSWRKATADYHSRTLIYGEPYAGLVYGAWERIINKVADARAGRPILNASAGVSSVRASSARSYASRSQITHTRGYHSMHLHDIALGRDTTRENGVIVVRPQYAADSEVQQASLEDSFVSQNVSTARVKSGPERSAIAPDGAAVISSGEEVSHGAQIVKISSNGNVSAKGQFQPSAHVVHVGDTTPSTASFDSGNYSAIVSGNSAASATPFVFNN